MLHFPSSPQNKSEDTIVNAWQWAQYNSEECEQWPLGKLYSDFTFDLFSQEQYSLNKVTPVGDWCVLVCWLLCQFLKKVHDSNLRRITGNLIFKHRHRLGCPSVVQRRFPYFGLGLWLMVVRFLERLVYILHLSRSDECGCHLCWAPPPQHSHLIFR